MSSENLLRRLEEIVGPQWIRTEADALATFGKDWTSVYPAAPLAVVLPRTVEQVQQIVRLANEQDFALVPSGGRTGLSGGAVAANGELVLAFDRMNKILGFDPTDR